MFDELFGPDQKAALGPDLAGDLFDRRDIKPHYTFVGCWLNFGEVSESWLVGNTLIDLNVFKSAWLQNKLTGENS